MCKGEKGSDRVPYSVPPAKPLFFMISATVITIAMAANIECWEEITNNWNMSESTRHMADNRCTSPDSREYTNSTHPSQEQKAPLHCTAPDTSACEKERQHEMSYSNASSMIKQNAKVTSTHHSGAE